MGPGNHSQTFRIIQVIPNCNPCAVQEVSLDRYPSPLQWLVAARFRGGKRRCGRVVRVILEGRVDEKT
jgi:MOSC domain-containing protein YiiM